MLDQIYSLTTSISGFLLALPAPLPLVIGCVISLAVFQACVWLYQRVKSPLLNPLLVTLAVMIMLLLAFGVPMNSYEDSVQLFSFMLGPATVALAYSVYR